MRRAPWLPALRDGAVRRALARRRPGRAVAAADPAGPGRQAQRSSGFSAVGGHRAGVHRVPTTPSSRPGTRTTGPDRVNRYNVDYSILGTSGSSRCCATSATPCTPRGCGWSRRRASATSASTRSRSATTRCSRPPTTTSLYKTAAKEIAAAHGKSLTFMGKYDEREGNSCHIHMSLRGSRRRRWSSTVPPTVAAASGRRVLRLRRRRARDPARVHPALRAERQLLQALRSRHRSPRPPSRGARTTGPAPCGSSGTAPSLRLENRVPGGDVNPYLALAAMLAGGLHGVRNELRAGRAVRRQRLHRRPARVPEHAARGPRAVRRAATLAGAGVRQRRRRPLRATRRTSSSRPSRPR